MLGNYILEKNYSTGLLQHFAPDTIPVGVAIFLITITLLGYITNILLVAAFNPTEPFSLAK